MKPIQFLLEFRSGLPIYQQIFDQVRSQIDQGLLQPGDQLPTVRQVALDLRVNFNTVARAYRLLDEAGLISTQQGRGTYILKPVLSDQVGRLSRSFFEQRTRDYLAEMLRAGFNEEEICEMVKHILKKALTENAEIVNNSTDSNLDRK